MTSKPDGWPVIIGAEVGSNLTLRDYFAAAALQGMIASDWDVTKALHAETAYKFADAMLAERSK